MAKQNVSVEMNVMEARIVAKRCARLKKTAAEVLWDRSVRDIVREESYAAVDRLISEGNIPEAIVSSIENAE